MDATKWLSFISQVADYKAPVLESGGGLQQGTYVPKSKAFIYLYESKIFFALFMGLDSLQIGLDSFQKGMS